MPLSMDYCRSFWLSVCLVCFRIAFHLLSIWSLLALCLISVCSLLALGLPSAGSNSPRRRIELSFAKKLPQIIWVKLEASNQAAHHSQVPRSSRLKLLSIELGLPIDLPIDHLQPLGEFAICCVSRCFSKWFKWTFVLTYSTKRREPQIRLFDSNLNGIRTASNLAPALSANYRHWSSQIISCKHSSFIHKSVPPGIRFASEARCMTVLQVV